jgi:hypothetical protein
MAQKIITFRPSEDAGSIIESRREEGCNISSWLNSLILESDKPSLSDFCQVTTVVGCGESSGLVGNIPLLMVTPIGNLSAKKYKESIKLLHDAGMDLFRFTIDAERSISIPSVTREQATIEFFRYFRQGENGEYIRTDIPLFQMLYAPAVKRLYITTYERNK